MFSQVKTKLTLLYSISLLCLLILFIILLYFFISHEINKKEVEELTQFFLREKGDFIEDLDEKDHHGLEYDPNRTLFYYVYNQQGKLIDGEETIPSFNRWIENNVSLNKNSKPWKVEWKENHLFLIKEPLISNGRSLGYVLIGMNITSEVHLIQNITWSLLVLTLLFSLVIAFLGYYFAGQAMKPIKNAFQKQERFVSDASHELRTPLSIFYSSIDLLIREEKDHLSPYGKEVLQDVKTEAGLMNSLINNLLFLARSDKNHMKLECKEINLSNLVLSVYTKFSRIKSKPLQFEQAIRRDIYLNCDDVKIQQLLYILLDNAFRYTNTGRVKVSLKKEKGLKIITVEDTGCGIEQADLPYIFDRFFQADISREKGGSGLGLSIAKTIVAAHGGKISVSSTKGEGSVFTVIFKEQI